MKDGRGEKAVMKIESIKEERVDVSGIDWNYFTQEDEVEFEIGKEKKLALTNWSQTTYYGHPAIQFDVLIEDEKPVKKRLITKSRRLIRQLKPLISQAFGDGRNEINVMITRFGRGYETDYLVRELK